MKQFMRLSVIAIFIVGTVNAQFSEGKPALHSGIGPSFSYMLSLELEYDNVFEYLTTFSTAPEFDVGPNATESKGINSSNMVFSGFEGFGEVTPHWTIGMYAGIGEYKSSGNDAQDIEYYINYTVNQVGLTTEFNTHSRSRLMLLGGSMFGIGYISVAAQATPGNETWEDIISGTDAGAGVTGRKAFEVSAWTLPVVQPYLGFRFDISRLIGLKTVVGYSYQMVSAGKWSLYNSEVIVDSPEMNASALFLRTQLYVTL
jgi:hypothetical protein